MHLYSKYQMMDLWLMAYGFDYNLFYIYDLQSNYTYGVQPTTGNLHLTPCDINLAETTNHAIAVGYLRDGNLSNSLMYATVYLWQFNPISHTITIINCTRLHSTGYHFSEYHPGPKLSVDIKYYNNTNLVAIGNSPARSIEIYMFDNNTLSNIHTYESEVETFSICWLSDGH